MRLVHDSLHNEAAATLRERIFSGELAPGSFLDESALCASLQVSRTPLREALKVLTAEGLVRHEPRRGCFVGQVTEQDLDEIFPVIALLEGRCALEATRHATPADLDVLRTLHERLAEHAHAGDVSAYYEANFAIHEAFIVLAGNRWLAQVVGDLRKILKLSRLQSLQGGERMQQSLREHLAIFAAIEAGDGPGAEAEMRSHLTRQREALRELAMRDKSSRLSA